MKIVFVMNHAASFLVALQPLVRLESCMKCEIGGKIVDAKVTENLGYQGGRYAKVVQYNGDEYIVTAPSRSGPWKNHVASIQVGTGYTGQANTLCSWESNRGIDGK